MIRKKEKNRLIITGGLLSLVFTSAAEKHEYLNHTYPRFIYILGNLNSSSFTFWSSQFNVALEATEPVSELVTQMTLELINNYLISVQQKR